MTDELLGVVEVPVVEEVGEVVRVDDIVEEAWEEWVNVHSKQTEVRTRRNRAASGRGRDCDSNGGIDNGSGIRLAGVGRGAKAKETTKFICYAISSVGLSTTTSMSKWATWHDFSFVEERKERKKEKRNVGGEGGDGERDGDGVVKKKQE
jgi:hypothetical protein